MRARTYMRMRLYNTHFVFIVRRRYHYRAARHVIPACTSPDYLYGARCSLPRREKCTLDRAKPPLRVCDAYTRNTTRRARVSPAQWRVCALYIMDAFAYPTDGIRMHLGAVYERGVDTGVCARARCGNFARNCHKETPEKIQSAAGTRTRPGGEPDDKVSPVPKIARRWRMRI